jgi:hypothetical protein
MSKSTRMSRVALLTGSLCIVLTAVVFVLGEGPRRWYSGIFFAITGAVMLVNAKRWQPEGDQR